MNAVWSGTLSFGLVTIPIKLYPATQPKDVRFHMVDRESGRRVRYKRVVEGTEAAWHDGDGASAEEPGAQGVSAVSAPRHEIEPATSASPAVPEPAHEVAYEDLVRGYEVEPGRFVTLDPEEIEAIRPQRSRTIDIEEFVDLDAIDPVYFEKSYYVAPRRDAEQPYALLLQAMRRTGLVGIGRFVLRTKPHLVAIRPTESALGLETLYFADEVRSAEQLVPGSAVAEVTDRELALAEQLISMLTSDWEPSKYADEYREELLRIISERTPQEAAEDPGFAEEPGARVKDLMDALKASVEQAGTAKKRRRTSA